MSVAVWREVESYVSGELAPVSIGDHSLLLETLDDLDGVIQALASKWPKDQAPEAAVSEVCPHFGVLWPSALALSQHLTRCRRTWSKAPAVLELGCGLGVPSMIASKCGAKSVLATDRHPLVPHLLQRNAARNGISTLHYQHLDWRTPSKWRQIQRDVGPFDLIIGSDLLYEAWQPGCLAMVLAELLQDGGEAIISDPGRKPMDQFVRLVEASGLQCELEEIVPTQSGSSSIDVFVMSVRG